MTDGVRPHPGDPPRARPHAASAAASDEARSIMREPLANALRVVHY